MSLCLQYYSRIITASPEPIGSGDVLCIGICSRVAYLAWKLTEVSPWRSVPNS